MRYQDLPSHTLTLSWPHRVMLREHVEKRMDQVVRRIVALDARKEKDDNYYKQERSLLVGEFEDLAGLYVQLHIFTTGEPYYRDVAAYLADCPLSMRIDVVLNPHNYPDLGRF